MKIMINISAAVLAVVLLAVGQPASAQGRGADREERTYKRKFYKKGERYREQDARGGAGRGEEEKEESKPKRREKEHNHEEERSEARAGDKHHDHDDSYDTHEEGRNNMDRTTPRREARGSRKEMRRQARREKWNTYPADGDRSDK